MPNLFNWRDEPFTLHSGSKSPFLIDCKALRKSDWDAIANYVVDILGLKYCAVFGVPEGGLKLAEALYPYCEPDGPVLIADDVLTTGKSMEEYKATFPHDDIIGVVLFARGPVPDWVTPIWRLDDEKNRPLLDLLAECHDAILWPQRVDHDALIGRIRAALGEDWKVKS